MNFDLKTLLRVAGLVCNLISAALAAAALYLNREASVSIATSAWSANDLFRDVMLSQSRFIIASVCLLALGTALQAGSELVKRRKHDVHGSDLNGSHPHATEAEAGEHEGRHHHRHNHNHH